ncbi:MAG: class I SAM-dependent methyltransferase [Pseudorhodoplanes sp.]
MNQVKPQMDARTRAGSPERFGYSWDEYSELLDVHRRQFEGWTAALPADAWRGNSFLDVGCGMGRNSFWAMQSGAAGGLAIDVDERTLAAARRTLSPHPAVEVRRQSVYELPERARFDIAFSIGVVHHLEDPDAALAAMTNAVKPGGRVLVWLYGYENNRWIVWIVSPLREKVLSKLPLGLLHALSVIPTAMLWTALRLGLGRIAYYRMLRGFSFRHLRAIVFDQLLPEIARYYRREEVESLMRRAGLTDIEIVWVNEMSWSAAGRRPN